MSCACEKPRELSDPRREGTCGVCGKVFDSAWLSNDETVNAFFDRLAAGLFPGPPTADFESFRGHCEAREFAGRDTFGLAYLSRDNCSEALEEAVDLALYMHLDVLKHLREDGDDEDMALALTAAKHAFLAHKAVRELAAKRQGAP